MCYVEVRQGSRESTRKHIDYINDALKELKRRMKKEGVFYDLKKCEFYRSPSQKRRWKRNEAQKQRRIDERRSQWMSRKPINSK